MSDSGYDDTFLEVSILKDGLTNSWEEVRHKLTLLSLRELLDFSSTLDTIKEHTDNEINRRRDNPYGTGSVWKI